MKNLIINTFLLLFISIQAIGQNMESKPAFKYQAVARDASGNLMTQRNVGVMVKILDGQDAEIYSESHNVTTSDLGIFTLAVGGGDNGNGNMSEIPWGGEPFFLEVALDAAGGTNFVVVGKSEILGVPFAYFAAEANTVSGDLDSDDQNEIQTISIDGNVLTLSNNGGSVNLPESGGNGDGDSDPNNEIQTLSKSGNEVSLNLGGGSFIDEVDDLDADPSNEIQNLSITGKTVSITNGNSITLPDSEDDADADPSNEIQTLSKNGNTIQLTDGGEVTDEVNDADADPNNEIQSLSVDGTTLTISDGNSVVLPDGGDDDDADPNNEIQILTKSGSNVMLSKGGGSFSVNDGDSNDENEIQTLSLNGNNLFISNGNGVALPSGDDDDADPNNEIQILSKNGSNVSLSKGGGSFIDAVNDADADPNNEIQTISLSGSNLSLSNGGGSVALPSGGSSPWAESGTTVSYSGKYTATSGDVSGELEVGNLVTTGSGVITNGGGEIATYLGPIGGSTGGMILGNNGNNRVFLSSNSDAGFVRTNGPNGNMNVQLYNDSSPNTNCGRVTVYDNTGSGLVHLRIAKIGLQGDGGSTQLVGAIDAAMLNTVIDHPTNPEKEICYTALEGPEAAAYSRGQIEIINGVGHVAFSDDFRIMASAQNMTIMLTPHSADSKGLAAIERTENGFVIKELFQGNGNYTVDWEAKSVRKGYEMETAVRSKTAANR